MCVVLIYFIFFAAVPDGSDGCLGDTPRDTGVKYKVVRGITRQGGGVHGSGEERDVPCHAIATGWAVCVILLFLPSPPNL